VTYYADVWDGTLSHDGLGISAAANEAEAVQEAKAWAKSLDSVPENAWLRVNINGTIRSFRFGEF
jgi:hypothetical protein